MKKIIFLILIFFVGCGSDKVVSDDEPTTTNKTNYTNYSKEPLFYQQWAIEYNQTFYEDNQIDKDANIHTNDLLKKYSGKGVKVAIIDDYVDTNHEDLTISKTYSIITHSQKLQYSDDDLHGTAVTGIIAARANKKGILGIAYNSEIIFIQMNNSMAESEIIEMFEKAKELGADIINCSWGTYTQSDALQGEINKLVTNGRDKKGIIILFAVGNDNQNLDEVDDESKMKNIIAVGATNSDNKRAVYSNYGSNLDVMAPGGYYYGITTTDISGNEGYNNTNYNLYDDKNSFAGTSAATPIMSGVIALMLEENPNLTYSDIMNIIKNYSDKIGTLEYKNDRNNYYGYGKVNLSKYLEAIK